jgi:ABC-type ATPase with predicted acetyltransferase domain
MNRKDRRAMMRQSRHVVKHVATCSRLRSTYLSAALRELWASQRARPVMSRFYAERFSLRLVGLAGLFA